MKIFTVRDLDRQPSRVLEACEVDGVAAVRSRDGRVYEVRPVAAPSRTEPAMAVAVRRHLEWKAATFRRRISAKQARKVDDLLSEERG